MTVTDTKPTKKLSIVDILRIFAAFYFVPTFFFFLFYLMGDSIIAFLYSPYPLAEISMSAAKETARFHCSPLAYTFGPESLLTQPCWLIRDTFYNWGKTGITNKQDLAFWRAELFYAHQYTFHYKPLVANALISKNKKKIEKLQKWEENNYKNLIILSETNKMYSISKYFYFMDNIIVGFWLYLTEMPLLQTVENSSLTPHKKDWEFVHLYNKERFWLLYYRPPNLKMDPEYPYLFFFKWPHDTIFTWLGWPIEIPNTVPVCMECFIKNDYQIEKVRTLYERYKVYKRFISYDSSKFYDNLKRHAAALYNTMLTHRASLYLVSHKVIKEGFSCDSSFIYDFYHSHQVLLATEAYQKKYSSGDKNSRKVVSLEIHNSYSEDLFNTIHKQCSNQ